jgi:cytochrome b561
LALAKAVNTDNPHYRAGAKWLHWLIALMVFGLLGAGLYMVEQRISPQTIRLYMLHKSMGLTVLLLMLVRVVYRLINRPPALPPATKRWQKAAAHVSHFGLYALVLAMPISGWLMNSASGFPMKYFGLFRVPNLVERSQIQLDFYKAVHGYLAWALIVLIAVHVLAALQHHFFLRDTILRRMLPMRKQTP